MTEKKNSENRNTTCIITPPQRNTKQKKNLFSTNNIDKTIHEIIKIASFFEAGCQHGQKAINADHLYISFLIINWINPDRRTDSWTDRQIQTYIQLALSH